ncbi:hypothetical protein H5410_030789 [Solanum commersonii]|uniref:DNA helicase Pif1-like 2B domain-containing protein n=1 Tax=Solanum commersonii TaxID=4109 RepID=A0A9J5YFA4_SOLCO|nr:hypothetical protein H5410_030789 [Solanum commersonii]
MGMECKRQKMEHEAEGKSSWRIYFAHPVSGECFSMRMLLNFVKWCTSFQSIRRVNEVNHKTYRKACYTLGLLDDNKEWNDCLVEASGWATENELKHLLVMVLMHYQVCDARQLWKNNYEILSQDITTIQRKRLCMKDLQLNEKQIEAYTLVREGSNYDATKKDMINMPTDYNDPAYLKEKSILTPKNELVHELNDIIIKMIPGEGRTYYSSDDMCKTSTNTDEEDILYPTKFLNNLRFPGIPNHDIHLKVGILSMLLRNLNQTKGFCNGTRIVITHLGIWSVSAKIISAKNLGSRVTIPRTIMSPNESKCPFKLKRRQLPLATCYAMTINKSQGQTLHWVGLYLPKHVFTHGQLYVAISQVTTREGLTVLNADDDTKYPTFIKNIIYEEVF